MHHNIQTRYTTLANNIAEYEVVNEPKVMIFSSQS